MTDLKITKSTSRLILMFLSGFVLMSVSVMGFAQTSASSSAPVNIGGLAWIEPKSRIIKLGIPNVMEGARIEKLYVDEGAVVQKGQVLGIYSTYAKNKAALDVAESRLALSKADLARVKAGNKQSDISSQRQIVNSLQAAEKAASEESTRMTSLFGQQLASKSQYDKARADMEGSVARRKSAEQTLESLKSVRPDDVMIAELKVQVAQSEVSVAKTTTDLSIIIAPIDGTILTLYAREGESVGSNGVLDIANLNVIDAVVEIDENDILKIAKGQRADIKIAGMDVVNGVVREIGGQIKRNAILDPADPTRMLDTRVLEVRVQLNPTKNNEVARLINKKARATIYISSHAASSAQGR